MPTTRATRSARADREGPESADHKPASKSNSAGRAGPEPSEGPRGAGEPEGEDRKPASRSIYTGRVVKLSLDTVALPNGHTVDLEMIRHPGASAMVPVDDEGNVILVRQYRYATNGYLLEVPAGKLDGGEAPESCAHRELAEECGQRAARLMALGWIWTTPGFTDEKIWLYLARGLSATAQALEHDEVLTVERLPWRRAVDMAMSGEITDAKSVVALLRAAPHLEAEEKTMTSRGLAVQDRYAPKSICFGCGPANTEGLQIKSHHEGDSLVATWHAKPHHHAFPGMLAGGIVGTLLDCHSNWTAAMHLMARQGVDHPPVTVTADYAVKLRRPIPTDGPIQLRARVVESTDDRAVVEAELEAGGKVCASCRGTFVAVKPGHPAYHRW